MGIKPPTDSFENLNQVKPDISQKDINPTAHSLNRKQTIKRGW